MKGSTAVFTSIAANYLPKARVLARSVQQVAPDAHFVLMLVDEPPHDFDAQFEPFNEVMTLNDLGLEDPLAWAFTHTVVELCTAVKGRAARQLLEREGTSRVFYFDPDMVVFGRFEELERALSEAAILLTPHQTDPEIEYEAIMDNEMASLKHGVFNMGFVGIADSPEGCRFAAWWADRLTDFCLDDIGRGLFTDQKWANLIPCFFDDYRVLRSPAFNVATWNITTRRVTGSIQKGVEVNGEPLGFYHFSGFDSGDQALMLNKYGADSPTLRELREWYIEASEAEGQSAAATRPYGYGAYDDGVAIKPAERRLYRARADLRKAFPDPFSTAPKGGYRGWYEINEGDAASADIATPSDETPTGEALKSFASWLRQRGQRHHRFVKRWTLLGLAHLLKLVSRGAR